MNVKQPTLQSPATPDLTALFKASGYEIGKLINCVRVGVVQAFYPATQTADVQIAQQQITSVSPTGDRTLAAYAPLVHVPVIFPSGGGYTLTFPIAAGDECVVFFNDRELDNWYLQGGVNSAPSTSRTHDLSDGLCLVGVRSSNRVLSGVSTTTTQLRSDDGATYVSIDGGGHKVTLRASTEVVIDSPLTTIIGNINVEGTSGADTATIDCDLTQTLGKVLKAGNGATGSGTHVTVQNGIVTAVS
jgi:hypothetical protein